MISERTAVFQGLRLIGIVTIVAGHIGLNLVGCGIWCTFFFILSGFLYRQQINSWADYCNYIWKKISRLYPVYWTCLAAYLLLALVRGCDEQYTIRWDFLPYLFLVQTWIPGLDPFGYLLVSWFLSSLLFCYVCAPWMSWLVKCSKYSIVCLSGAMIGWQFMGYDIYSSPMYRLFECGLGMWLFNWLGRNEQCVEPFPGMTVISLLVGLVGLHFGMSYWWATAFFAGVICMVYNIESVPLRWLLGNKCILWVSKAGMLIYLTHTGIGFHLMFYFFSYNAVVVTIGSVVFGIAFWIIYCWIQKAVENQISGLLCQK